MQDNEECCGRLYFAYRQVVNNRSYIPLVSKLGIPATERAERIFFTFVSSELVVGAACAVTQRGIKRGSPDKIRLADAGATGGEATVARDLKVRIHTSKKKKYARDNLK